MKKQSSSMMVLISLIAAVGGIHPRKTVGELSIEEWKSMIDLNLTSAFLLMSEMERHLSNKTYGRIITIGAMSALQPSAGRGAYSASKAALVALTKTVAEEFKGTGKTANVIVPGIIRTKSNLESMPDEDSSHWVDPIDIAQLILHLCSDAGNSINGAVIPILGGL